MLRNKIIRFKKIYKFYFDYLLVKCSFWFNCEKCYYKSKIEFFGQTLRHTKKMLRNEIVRFKKMYKSYFDNFLIGIIVFLINMKNSIK